MRFVIPIRYPFLPEEPNPCFGFRSTLPRSVPDPRFSNVTEPPQTQCLITMARWFPSNINSPVGTEVSYRPSYTYGHAFDEVSNGGIFSFTSGSSLSPQDPHNLRGSYGPAEYVCAIVSYANYAGELPLKSALGGRGPDFLFEDGRFPAPCSCEQVFPIPFWIR